MAWRSLTVAIVVSERPAPVSTSGWSPHAPAVAVPLSTQAPASPVGMQPGQEVAGVAQPTVRVALTM